MPDNKSATRGVIFDLDGTLVDTLGDIAAAVNVARLAHDLPGLDSEEYRSRVGWGIRELARLSFPEAMVAAEADLSALVEEVRAAYHRAPAELAVAYPGMTRLLRDLAEAGAALAVLSNKPDALTQAAMEATVLSEVGREFFVAIYGQREGVPAKPDPTVPRELFTAMGVSASECTYVGDSEVDVETARAAGCRSVIVSWGFRDRRALETAAPDRLCDTVAELRDALGLGQTAPER